MSSHGGISLMRRLRWGTELCLHFSGVGWAYSHMRRNGAVILMYHSVATPGLARFLDPRVRIGVRRFREQMRLLAQARNVLGMSQLARAMRSGSPPPKGVVVTFDDGYLDTLTVAAPILAEYGIPAIVYLATEYVTRQEPQWVDRLHHALTRRTRHELSLSDGRKLDLREPHAEARAQDTLEPRLLAARLDERTELLRDVEDQLKPDHPLPRLTMGWDDVRALSRRYPQIELGIHTAEHTDMTARPIGELRRELTQAQDTARNELGTNLRHFSFPYSRDNPASRELVRELGFETAVGSGDDFIVDEHSDPFHMPRIEPNENVALLSYWTSGAYPDLPRLLFGHA